MTDSLRKAGHGSRVPADVPASVPGPGARTAVADGPTGTVRASGLLQRPREQAPAIDRSLRARTTVLRAADPTHALGAPEARAAWAPSEAAWRARAFVNLRGGVHLPEEPTAVRDVLSAAIGALHAANLPHVAEALVRKVAQQDAKGPTRVALALVGRFADPRVPVDKSAQLVAGLLRGLDREPLVCELIAFMAREVVQRHSAQDRKAFGGGSYADANGLLDGLTALTKGAGGPRAPVGRLESLLAGFAQAIRPHGATAAAHQPVEPEDQATALGAVCKSLGGAGLPPGHRQAILAFLCGQAWQPASPTRAVMAYQFGVATGLWKAPAQVQREVLAAAGGTLGLSLVDVGALAWGFGMHLLGKDPEAAHWQALGSDIVTASGAPADQLVAAVARLADELPEICRQRLAAGLALASQLRSAADKVRQTEELAEAPEPFEATEGPHTSEATQAPDRTQPGGAPQ